MRSWYCSSITTVDPFALPPSFWSKVEKSADCWLWTAAKVKGYGIFRHGGQEYRAHRAVLEWHTADAGEGLYATHGPCHCRHCVNPAHLSWQTAKGNAADRLRDGTHSRGERQYSHKLTEEQVLAIRPDPRPQLQIAADYGISRSTVSHIKTRRKWGWLE